MASKFAKVRERSRVIVPIYEYTCQACGHQFEALVRGRKRPACPSCESRDLQRLLSLPSLRTPTTKEQSLKAAKARDAARAKERMHDQLHYERSHDRHG